MGPLKFKRMPEGVRRQVEVAAASAWEGLVEVHADHALRFVSLMAGRMPFSEAVSRYLNEMDVRDPMASSIRSRVLIALEDARAGMGGRSSSVPSEPVPGTDETGDGLRRFRPDVLVKGIARRVRETEEAEQWIALAIARAEEAVIRAHIENAITFAGVLQPEAVLSDAVEDYIELLRISGGRAQAVFQRTMARLADLHLPGDRAIDAGSDAPEGA
ncbi:MAG TPA: hypothetical protein VMM12_16960 [Longimicrobiales bacterium]|nr:hypothetical protein [Longimicrobiales bacterium]